MGFPNTAEVVIAGAGPAGLTAALYCGRAGLDTVVVERLGPGGQAATTAHIENYPGFPGGVTGPELGQRLEEQARAFGAQLVLAEVQGVSVHGGFTARTSEGNIDARALIVASGARERPLGVPGESEFRGRGVSYCATCDGAFYRNRRVVVVGGGDSAIEEALFLTRFASQVTVVHRRGALRAAKVLQERAFSHAKLNFVWNTVVAAVLGREKVEGVQLMHVGTGRDTEYPADGVFVCVGKLPNSELVRSLVKTDAAGYVVTGEDMSTSLPGLYAAGDVRAKYLKQVATAVSDGAVAGVAVERYLAASP